jgi:hypothetical protein
MILSVLLNLVTAAAAAAAVAGHCRNTPAKITLRYFTVLSNLFCAAASLAVAAARLCGAVPNGILMMKFVGTAAVTITFLTVMFFLGPVVYNYKVLLTGPDLWLHLVCPVIAILTLLLWDGPDMGFGGALWGVLPVLLYGGMYLYRILLAPPEKRWEDFYGFNRNGRWLLSVAAMSAAALAVSLLLWLLCSG